MDNKINNDFVRMLKSIEELKKENEQLRKSLDEEYRLNGMGQERELKLITENQKLKAMISASPTYYCFHQDGMWWAHEEQLPKDTHTAKLIDFLPIMKDSK